MNNKQILIGVGGIIIGVLLVNFIPGTMFSRYGNGGFGMMNGSNNSSYSRGVAGNNRMASVIDEHFIEQMIPHHEGAVAMANLALKKAKHNEVKVLANTIIEGQTKEIEDMKGWYKDWFGNDFLKANTGMMGGGMMSQSGMHMGGEEDMALLESAADFDKAFIEAMIPHHQLALMMVQMLEVGTNRPEMLTLAKNITTSQSKEIQEMQAWYKVWYGNN